MTKAVCEASCVGGYRVVISESTQSLAVHVLHFIILSGYRCCRVVGRCVPARRCHTLLPTWHNYI